VFGLIATKRVLWRHHAAGHIEWRTLGASRENPVWMVVRHGMKFVLAGVALGQRYGGSHRSGSLA